MIVMRDRRDVTLVFLYFLREYSGHVPSVPGFPPGFPHAVTAWRQPRVLLLSPLFPTQSAPEVAYR